MGNGMENDKGHCTRLSTLAVAGVYGADAADFLQAQLSADIATLGAGEARFSCYCSARGQVLALLLVCRRPDGFLLAGSAQLLPGVLKRLQLYVLRARVSFGTAADTAVFGLDDAPDAAPGNDPDSFRDSETGLAYGFSSELQTCSGGPQRWKARELRRGVAWLGEETTEKFIPQMLGFERIAAVSFSKGCYPGQEIVARARYLGKVKRRPLLLSLEVAVHLQAGEQVEILRGEEWLAATVIDTVAEDNGQRLVFAVAPGEETAAVTLLRVGAKVYRCATI